MHGNVILSPNLDEMIRLLNDTPAYKSQLIDRDNKHVAGKLHFACCAALT